MLQSSSLKNMRVRSMNNKQSIRPLSPQRRFDHKRQIQATLNQLHQLQAEIYSLNIPENPHSSGPTKKEIKQLSYLYESMTKPKAKNKLNIKLEDIKSSLQIINEGYKAIDEKVFPHKALNRLKDESIKKTQQISLLRQFTSIHQQQKQSDSRLKISSKTLKQVMKQLYNTQFDLSLVSETKTSRVLQIQAEQLEKFINYNEFDNFDPLKQSYNCLLDDRGRFSFKKYNQINEVFGLPKVKELAILKQSIGVKDNQQITFEVFKKIMREGEQFGLS